MLDFTRLRLKRTNNEYLVAPTGFTADPPHRTAPVFDRPVHRLAGGFREFALAQPRVTLLDVSVDGRRLELIQRSRFFRFPDAISVEFIAVDEGHATLAIYSRARYGSTDFGVNRKRIDAWIAALGGTESAIQTGEASAAQPTDKPAKA